jgi:outer membrane protein OmpA-like peptidoglycan-associated protein
MDINKNKHTRIFKRWIVPCGVAILLFLFFLFHKAKKDKIISEKLYKEENKKDDNETSQKDEQIISDDLPQDTSAISLKKRSYDGVQVIRKILKENADCDHTILVTDSIVFSPNSPQGSGNALEIQGNASNDPKFFEKEHNTIWYRYIAPDNGQLTFDIIPVSKNDDYDFMLYKFKGTDLQTKVITKILQPVRSCISRNDKKNNSMTGLKLDDKLPAYIHSGEGASYVKYIDVNKNDVFYLLVDNVYGNGNGHTVKFHLKPVASGELYIGQEISFESITFKDSDDEFKKGSEKGLDSLFQFLVHYPNIKVEIQGHVNSIGNNAPVHIPGKPHYTALELSQRRADVIAEKLIKKGISPERLTTRGYGNTRPKVTHPKTIKENIMNVRAEIVILSLN